MMSLMKKFLFAAALMTVIGVGNCQAEEPVPPMLLPVEKLSRGISNAAFGVLEVLYHTYDTTQESGGVRGLTYGILSGVCYFVCRELVGVLEVATFLFPLPGCPNDPNSAGWGYGPIMQPEWVVTPEHDWGNFVYQETSIVPQQY